MQSFKKVKRPNKVNSCVKPIHLKDIVPVKFIPRFINITRLQWVPN